ncbi:3-methylcrotonyl-CoA carboxylase alpha subunit [Halospina denitrificans]|uniref:Biotin carboxylase n=1 Tax=Halospina denitrificans TaxID=332522 RepID=A0A4R7JVE0_9GAMM|nr:biotin carboxylase N-terminal domain-containing protein [Halospina denitrificans]TDT41383.1 3-methylcrotonyl-CoA carboxylase alpha subunit [Halospina denitrificans]
MTGHTLLVANRGEIASRIIGTGRAMGLTTVAVYSEADAEAPFTREADQAYPIGPAMAAESYLNQDRILEAAHKAGADLIHPGYGFLSENTSFSERCLNEGIRFVGPGAEAIAAMGDKTAAKTLMENAGVPLVPGYHGEDQSLERLKKEAESMGMPLLIKASAGGGGKGMRVVRDMDDLETALDGVKREAKAAFGDDRLLLERFVDEPRHVEVQVLFDHHGNGIHLFDRDCSIQRRHQKIIEEAPAPNVTEATREAMTAAALRCGEAIGYRSAGTVEFLLGPDGNFYFMEMNTRLQVEHPVTEAITGVDLVEWQIRVALGECLPWRQADITSEGHAVEARVYAEDPDHGFLPTSGRISYLNEPTDQAGIRIDSGIASGQTVSNHYDPMLAKVIAHGSTRNDALERLSGALTRYHLAGFACNVGYLSRIINHEAFRGSQLRTDFVKLHEGDLMTQSLTGSEQRVLGLVGWLWLQPATRSSGQDPWDTLTGWRLAGEGWQRAEVHSGERYILDYCLGSTRDGNGSVRVREGDGIIGVHWSGNATTRSLSIQGTTGKRRELELTAIGQPPAGVALFALGESWEVRVNHPEIDLAEADTGSLTAPMHGRVVALHCQAGDRVKAGQPLVVMEAMKMEHTVTAPAEGVVTELFCSQDENLKAGHTLLSFEADDTGGTA